ncbi:MAG: hypothetical protein RJB39_756 [Candidatus Parcubacteria bacterium]|jgi:SsrA-binding protein
MSLVENRKARFNYEILHTYEAGIHLLGCEVKAVRGGQMSLDGAHITLVPAIIAVKKNGSRLTLIGSTIIPLQPVNVPLGYDPIRPRALLMKGGELDELARLVNTKGNTLIPLSIYKKRGLIKVEVAVVRGKKKFDKRESIKKKDAKREIGRMMKGL